MSRSQPVTLLLVAIALGRSGVVAQARDSIGLDHIILYTGSLAQGSAAFAKLTGVTPAPGGQHPGRGTQNALVSLGHGQYLELLAPLVDSGPAEPLRPTAGRFMRRTSPCCALASRPPTCS